MCVAPELLIRLEATLLRGGRALVGHLCHRCSRRRRDRLRGMSTSDGADGVEQARGGVPVPAWVVEDVQDSEAVVRTILDEGGAAQSVLAHWRAHSRDVSESWRLAALQCVLAAQEAFDSHPCRQKLPKLLDARRRAMRELRLMQSEFEKSVKHEISDEKIRELVALTQRSERQCRSQLLLCDGDVNRAAGRLLNLAAGDADTHQLSVAPEPAPQLDGATDTQQQLDAPAPAQQPDAATATGPRSETDCCGANHAFYLNLRQIRSSHPHNGRGVVPELRCLQHRTQSRWGFETEMVSFDGTIEDFHQAFGGRDEFSYSQLEGRHDYIQWLFPSPEASRFNAASLPLSLEEALAIRSDPIAKERIRRSFLLITDFYGFEMSDDDGTLRRNPRTWQSRFENLNTPGNHNFMRISRIINCLNNTGWEIYSKPFLAALYHEAFETRALNCCCDSFARYWMQLLPDWEDVAKLEFPAALAWLQRPAYSAAYSGGFGVGVNFSPPPVNPTPAPIGVGIWNFSDSTVQVFFKLKLVVSLGPNKNHGMHSREGDVFEFMLPPTGDHSPDPFAVWTVTDHHAQQVFAEGCVASGLSLGAVVCRNTHRRYQEHRLPAIKRITEGLLAESIPLTTQAICERGDYTQYAHSDASLQRTAPQRAAGVGPVVSQEKMPVGPPFTTGDQVQVHSQSSGGWHSGSVTKVISGPSAAPSKQVWHVSVEYVVDSQRREKLVLWEPGCGTIISRAKVGAAAE